MGGVRPHKERGIRRDNRGRIKAYVRVGDERRDKRFAPGTPIDFVRRWREETRASLQSIRCGKNTLASDIGRYLAQIDDRPRLVAERRHQLAWWAARLGHLRRDAIEPGDVRIALADLRKTHAASTCNHYRQALFSLYQALDGRDAPNPVREVGLFKAPAPKARALSYDEVRKIIAAMSDRGNASQGQRRAGASKAKVRCRVLAYTGLRAGELMRYLPEHWDRAAGTLVVYTGKGGSARTIPLCADAVAALDDLEAANAIGPFSTSTLWRAFRLGAKRAGITHARPYDLRHSYGTALYRVTGDLLVVKVILGHRDLKTTERYTLGYVPEAMRRATARFEEHLAEAVHRMGDVPEAVELR